VSPADIYQAALFVIGLAVLIAQTVRERGQLPPPALPVWRPSWLDFFLWLWVLAVVSSLATELSHFLAPPASTAAGDKGTAPDPDVQTLWLFIFECILLIVQLVIIARRWSWSPAPVNRVSLPARAILIGGAVAWLGAIPLIFATMYGWSAVLDILHGWLPDLETPLQVPVDELSKLHSPVLLAVFAISGGILAPVNEELFFRAGLYRFCKSRLKPRVALVVTNLLFAAVHVNLQEFLPLFVIGLLLTRAYERSGNIAVPMVFHALFNLNNIALIMLFPDLLHSTS
jgi:membrane protease YdiL (CAAX protease family)